MVVPLILINKDLQYTCAVMKNALGPAEKRPVSLTGACFVPVFHGPRLPQNCP